MLCSWARHFTLTVPLSPRLSGSLMGTVVLNGGGRGAALLNLRLGVNPAMECHPIQGRVETLLAASCYRHRDKLQPDGLLGSYVDLTLLTGVP